MLKDFYFLDSQPINTSEENTFEFIDLNSYTNPYKLKDYNLFLYLLDAIMR